MKQQDDVSSSVLLQVFEERCRYDSILSHPYLVKKELETMTNSEMIELYKYALELYKKPRDVKDQLDECISILEDQQPIQLYMNMKTSPNATQKSDRQLIDEVLVNITRRQKEKKNIVLQFIKSLKDNK